MLNAILIASAVLFIGTPSTKKTPSLAQVGDPLPPGAAACQVVYTRIKAPFDAGARGLIPVATHPLKVAFGHLAPG